MTPDLISSLPSVKGRYSWNNRLDKTTWFQVGGPADVIFKPDSLEDLCFFLKNRPADMPLRAIGVGSNLLVRDGGIRGVVIRLGRAFAHLQESQGTLVCGAGALDRNLALLAQDLGFRDFEFFAGIPGTLGGAVKMNAGAYGHEVKDHLIHATAVDSFGTVHHLTPDDLGFSYRHSQIPDDWIVVQATFRTLPGDSAAIQDRIQTIMREREETQPVKSRTGGSTFANPEGTSAWKLIDAAGCRGLQIGGAQMSEKHCNFMINTGMATAQDLETLGDTVRDRVRAHSGIELRWEIQRLGEQA